MLRALLVTLAVPVAVRAQHHHEMPMSDSARAMPAMHDHGMVGAQAVVSGTRLVNAIDGRTLTEGYVSQPAIMGHAALAGGRVAFAGTLNFEGLTLRRGELLGGVYGEGYVDRRHPHTLVHEAMAAVQGAHGAVQASLAAGKGFAPFGTDDPMMRPFERYPVNHHLAQILERAVIVGAVRVPRALLEVATFNGDEPTGPYDWPRLSHVGDSWSARVATMPVAGLEVQGSVASVRSPENRDDSGLDQRKWSAAARWAEGAPLGGVPDARARGTYALAEWALTDGVRDGVRVTVPGYRHVSLLAEGGVLRRSVELVARAERSDRGEEDRLVDPFRTPRPAPDIATLGTTRWTLLTLGAARPLALGARARVAPFVEGSWLSPRAVVARSVFDPVAHYGARSLWSVTAGVRLGAGTSHARMGRYGVAR